MVSFLWDSIGTNNFQKSLSGILLRYAFTSLLINDTNFPIKNNDESPIIPLYTHNSWMLDLMNND